MNEAKDLYPLPWKLVSDIFVDDANGCTVCLPNVRMGDTGRRQLQRVAHLIASAPAMYEALEALLENTPQAGDAAALLRYGKARAALAQARGEAL